MALIIRPVIGRIYLRKDVGSYRASIQHQDQADQGDVRILGGGLKFFLINVVVGKMGEINK